MTDKRQPERIDWDRTTWEGTRREQLARWARMSLDEILDAQERMAGLSAELAGARGPSDPRAAAPRGASRVSEPRPAYSADTSGRDDVQLSGCTPEPLMAYLKALGVLRLVSEQKDREARGWWKNDVFWLRSSLGREELARFFLEEYRPTPILAPWAGGSGFFGKDNKEAVEALSKGGSARVRAYAQVIERVRAILREEGVEGKPREEEKARLIRRYRRELPDDVAAWMDAVMVLGESGQDFAPLLGTGGNDGHLDFTQKFMQRIVSLGLHKEGLAGDQSRAWLQQALFATPAQLDIASVGQFSPGRAGGPNATQGMEGGSTVNPWDFVLMIEGTVLFACAAVRRFGVAGSSRAAFPFTVRSVAAAFASPGPGDEAQSRGELWVPLWSRRVSVAELRQLFGEGRAEVASRPARDGADFARAVAGLGVDRGIVGFSRVGFLKRNGRSFLAAPLGRFAVVERSGADLLREADRWLQGFRAACSAKDARPSLVSALRRVESAVFDFCEHGGAGLFQGVLVALGSAERALATAGQFREERRPRPLAALSPAWIETADDGSLEFTVALALASIHDPEGKIGPLRANLEPVDWKSGCRRWAKEGRSVAWEGGGLAPKLAGVLERRLTDAARAGCEHLPLDSRVKLPLGSVAEFLAGELDDDRVEELIWGLMLIRGGGSAGRARAEGNGLPVPRAYALLKLLFLPRPLVIERGSDGTLLARLLRANEGGGVVVRPEPSVLRLLRGGRLGEACAIAMRRLRASGLTPMPAPSRGRGARDREWGELDRSAGAGDNVARLAAALLIPVSDAGVSELVRLVMRPGEMA